jgi:excisionase family DNA binding protein
MLENGDCTMPAGTSRKKRPDDDTSPEPVAEIAVDFLTPGEVAQMFGVTPRTVANWCDKGRLAFVATLGGQRRILASSLQGLPPSAKTAP